MKTLLTGATGFIGGRLAAKLDRPHVLARDPLKARRRLGEVRAWPWDASAGPPVPAAFEGVEAVFHLAGDPVVKGRWTAAKKRRIRESRVVGTRNLVEAIAALSEKPKVLVCASAVGFYGPRGDEELTEASAPGEDFLAGVCRAWEDEANRAKELGMRVVNVRTGIVLHNSGGALKEMLLPFRLGLGGNLGDGTQWMSWIHVDDHVGLLLRAAEDEGVHGPVNFTAPNPVRNAEFTKALGAALGRPAVLPMPAFMVRVVFGEAATVMLASQKVLPAAALRAGYAFAYPDIGSALAAAV